jgi:acyl transferase domain-containing protein
MGIELWDAFPAFAAGMEECAAALRRYVDWSLEDVLRGAAGAPPLERVDVVQPALFAVMVSLARLWRSFGVEPTAVVGHSQGEIAAAHVAGGLSLDDAARVVALRSRALAEISGRARPGVARHALGSGRNGVRRGLAERAERYLGRFDGRVSLAAVNGPSAVVVSGESDALDELIATCEATGTLMPAACRRTGPRPASSRSLISSVFRSVAGCILVFLLGLWRRRALVR